MCLMCVSPITESKGRGWKVFCPNMNGERFLPEYFECTHTTKTSGFLLNRWYRAKQLTGLQASRMSILDYEAGFHIFKTHVIARRYSWGGIIREVEYQDAFLQGSCESTNDTIVARRMRIMEVNNE